LQDATLVARLDAAEAAVADLRGAAAARRWLDGVLRKKVIVHTRQDQSIEGVLMETTVDGLILRAARLLDASGKGTSMAGETFVPRENVAFAQLDE
jgi:hypothetical protein